MEEVIVGVIVSILIFLISSSIIIYGWDVIYGNAQKIASRNELFARKSAIISEVTNLTRSAIDFWESKHTEDDKAFCLVKASVFTTEIESIKRRIKRLESFGLDAQLDEELRQLRKNITLNSERAFDVHYSEIQDKISNIVDSSDTLKHKLSVQFEQMYSHARP